MTNHAERRRVAVLFGGRSSEHSISCVTARGVIDAIDESLFEVIPVGITKTGAFVRVELTEIHSYALTEGALPEVTGSGERVLWPSDSRSRELSVIAENGTLESLGSIDAVLPMLHGPCGEDGTVQGLLELIDMPFTGSGVLGSALCMDKHTAKSVLRDAGIAVAPWSVVTQSDVDRDRSVIASLDEGLTYPLFVKPARAGSSVGVSRVTDPSELEEAVEIALREDSTVLVEAAVTGREVEIGVLQGRRGQAARTSDVIGEIVFDGRDFYDFEAKYLGASGAQVVLPASATPEELRELQETALKTFEVTRCAGYARVDFFLTDNGPVVNEVNTLPGFTPISMFPKLWEASGLSYTDLITELIELGIETQRQPLRKD